MIFSEPELKREFPVIESEVDLVVAGGGLTGVCCSIAAARQGLRVALLQDRPVLGGNASSEVRLWALGATSHMGNNNRWSREGGIIDEILVENVYRNKEGNPTIFDMVLIDKVLAEKNIQLLLNTSVYEVHKDAARHLESVSAFNPQNGTRYVIRGKLFADCTGDGSLGYLAGATYRMGAEDAGEYGEAFVPDKKTYGELLGHSILFYMKDAGHPVKYTAPDFALKNVEEQIPKLKNPQYFNIAQHGCKYWWLEYGGRLDTIRDTEEIKFELWKVVYGVWDYIKNSGKFPQAENLTLEWTGLFPGKRESRRFLGLYTLRQQDIIEQRQHYDAVAYGGWAIDLHPSDGVFADGNACNQWHSKGVYQIPYRCYVSADEDNLFIGGRIMSTSHIANGSTRVMCTAALGGEAIGTAAYLCLKNGCTPAGLAGQDRIRQLQSLLVQNGNFLPGTDVSCPGLPSDDVKMEVSSALQLEELEWNGEWFRLECAAAELIPVCGKVPPMRIKVKADASTTLKVELRSSLKPGNYTPDRTDAVAEYQLREGENEIRLDFGTSYDSPRYAFVCFAANPLVSLPLSDVIVTGVKAVFNQFNPAVSNFGKQEAPEGIGVESFEFWCPRRRPFSSNLAIQFVQPLDVFGPDALRSQYFRPYLAPNAWVADSRDEHPCIRLTWPQKRRISSLTLFFDTDADNALETVQMGHYDAVMPCCYRNYEVIGDDSVSLRIVEGNHQSRNVLVFDKEIVTDTLSVRFDSLGPKRLCGLMGILVN